MKNKIAFLGYFCDSTKYYDKILSTADNNFQYGYMKSLYPSYDLKKISTNNVENKNYNYCNDGVTYIGGKNKITKMHNLYKELKNQKCIIYYNDLLLYNLICLYLKRFKRIKYIIIMITDPYDIKSRNILRKIMFFFSRKISNLSIKKADGIIAINKEMKINNKNIITINGGIDEKLLKKYKNTSSTKREILLYTGNLYYRYNLDLIIKVVKKINKIKFEIYGNGEQRDFVKSQCDGNIKYGGILDKDKLINEQKSAYALIALLNNDELSKKTFPSKIFEYLATGNEVIISNLSFFDSELKKYCHVVDEINESNLEKILDDVFIKKIKKNDISRIYDYLLNNYTWESYTKTIKKMVDGVIYEKNI